MARLTGIHKFTVLTVLLLTAGTIGPRASGETTILDFRDLPSGEMSSYSSEIPEAWWKPFSIQPISAVSQMRCSSSPDDQTGADCMQGEKFLVSILRSTEGSDRPQDSPSFRGNLDAATGFTGMASDSKTTGSYSASGDDVGSVEPRPEESVSLTSLIGSSAKRESPTDQPPPVFVRNRMEFFWSEGVQSVEFDVLTIVFGTARLVRGGQVNVVLRIFGFPDGVTQGDRTDAIRELGVQPRQLRRSRGRGRIALESDGNVIRRAVLEFSEPYHVVTSAEDALFMGVAEMSYTTAQAPVPAPNLVGEVVAEAARKYPGVEIQYDELARGLSLDVKQRSRIDTQDPQEGKPLSRERTIVVGIQPEIPDLFGMTMQEARRRVGSVFKIESDGPLLPESVYDISRAIDQTPDAPGYADRDSIISVLFRPLTPGILEFVAGKAAKDFPAVKLRVMGEGRDLLDSELNHQIVDQRPTNKETLPADRIVFVSLRAPDLEPPVERNWILPVVAFVLVGGGALGLAVWPDGPGVSWRANRIFQLVPRTPKSRVTMSGQIDRDDGSGFELKTGEIRTSSRLKRTDKQGL